MIKLLIAANAKQNRNDSPGNTFNNCMSEPTVITILAGTYCLDIFSLVCINLQCL